MQWDYKQIYARTYPGGPENWKVESPREHSGRKLMELLREAGAGGWEAVPLGIVEDRNGNTLGAHYLMKRPY